VEVLRTNPEIPKSYREVVSRMNSLSSSLIILLALFFAACVPQSPKSTRKSTKAASTGTTATPTPSAPTFSGNAYWYNGQVINGVLEIPDTFSSVVYLRGDSVNSFLAQSSAQMSAVYCTVISFNSTGAKDQLRVRAVPLTFNNFQTGQLERLFRVDMNLISTECDGAVGNLGQLVSRAPFYLGNTSYLAVSNGTTGKGIYYNSSPGATFSSRSFNDVKDSNGNSLLSNTVNKIYAHGTTVVVGTQSGLGLSLNNASSFSAPSTFKNKNISAIGGINSKWAVAADNQLYITGDNGVTFNSFSYTAGTPSINEIVGIQSVSDYIFISTNSGVFYTVNDGGSFTQLTASTTNGISVGGGKLFIATNSGLLKYDISAGGAPVSQGSFTTGNGLGSNIINDVAVNAASIYIATSAGLSVGLINAVSFSNTVLSGGEPKEVAAALDNAVVTMSGGGTVYYDGATVITPSLTTKTFEIDDVCPTCNSLTSTNVALYQISAGSIDDTTRVSSLDSAIGALGLKISGNGSSGGSGGTCTNNDCQAQGFDCCLENQCVIDSTERPGAAASLDPLYYSQAQNDVASNSALFVNYPDVYYVCTQAPPVTTTPTPQPDAVATATARLQEEYAQYLCLQGAAEDPVNYANCIDGDGDSDNDEDDYNIIRLRVWDRCGCEAEPLEQPYCPDYGLTATFDTNGNVQTVSCLIPPPDVQPTPFQSLSINVPGKSVPHRFFRSVDGKKVDDISTISNITPEIVPEGTPFAYLDESSKTAPLDSPYNMNDILGQMSVSLTQALPAKIIKLEFGADYVISATSGFYTPCPQCARDAWYDSFTAHPSSRDGLGVQAVGYTTRRDILSNNSSFGNYEDSIFGRACWVPPTMLPFTHKPEASVMAQREARLRAQAALWVNGYQRDWFGFNKGALIGSFDGVKWFAIGNGRKVTSTSESLYLAINAPFGNLADTTDIAVNIVADLGNNSVANVDYDPTVLLNDSRQNRAGSCQRFHVCEKDIDCVSRLGWEYTCANVDVQDISWPKFDSTGDEVIGENTNFGLEDIIFGNAGLQGGAKRCVYRGAGAPCAKDWSVLTDDVKENFRCAPNFFCADLDANIFNDRVVREPAALQTYQYGKESDVLGRPVNYVLGFSNLDGAIKDNLEYNAAKNASKNLTASNFGICRPGKAIADDNLINQHSIEDNQARTDFINQIASCPSDLSTVDRVRSCPLINVAIDDPEYGNFIYEASGTASAVGRNSQNMCGAEWKDASAESIFKDIEAESLITLGSLFAPSMAMDACLRKAGSICHTDLDCGPNRLHAEQAIFLDQASFNGSTAEYQYWTESLVCRQGTTPPSVFDPTYEDFDMSLNACCRELGTSFTMYTNIAQAQIDENLDNPQELNILTSIFPNGKTPDGTKPYSRYSILADAVTNPTAIALNDPKPVYPKNLSSYAGSYDNPAFQWKAFNDTGNKTCCGGSWVRKFSDGSHDWTTNNRLSINTTNFSCLNYESDIHNNKPGNVLTANYNKDLPKLCLNPAENGCVEKGIKLNASDNSIVPPSNITTTTGTISTMIDDSNIQTTNAQAYYQPVVFRNASSQSTDFEFNLIQSPFKPRTMMILPLYVGSYSNINNVRLIFDGADMDAPVPISNGATPNLVDRTGQPDCTGFQDMETAAGYVSGAVPASNSFEAGRWCVANLTASDGQLYTTLIVIANPYRTFNDEFWDYAGVEIDFNVYGTSGAHPNNAALNTTATTKDIGLGMSSGNANYYETKLGRLELLGIPQIFYEPIYCNSQRDVLVPGIFDSLINRADFEANSITYQNYTPLSGSARRIEGLYDPSNPAYASDVSKTGGIARVAFKDKVKLPDIFSGHEFTCCRGIGNVTESASRCCSNFADTNNDGDLVCLIPSGTDLNVYFNKFVSSEGMGETLPGGGLLEKDFIPETGEPKLTSEVTSKIETLGIAFCQGNAIRNGAALGSYYPQPNSGSFNGDPEAGRTYSINDSPLDYDPDRDTGTILFNQGYRWGHHVYCQ